MEKRIVKEEDFEKMIYQRHNGTQENFKEWFYGYLQAILFVGFVLGILFFFVVSIFSPTNAQSIATQLCQNVNGYLVSYKYNYFNYNFESVICQNSYGLIKIIY
jgi:hypothetical protein